MKRIAIPAFTGLLAMAALCAAMALVLAGPDASDTGRDPTRAFLDRRHPHQPEDCGVLLTGKAGLAGHGSHQVRLQLAIDDAWRARFNGDSQDQARSIVDDVAPLFQPFGIELVVAGVTQWRSGEGTIAAAPLLADVMRSVHPSEDGLVVALTGHQLFGTDGLSVVGGRYALVGYHAGHPERDRLVAAHELGHLLGARDLPHGVADRSLMTREGYAHDLIWAACHERLLRLNAAVFQNGDQAAD